MATKLVVHLGLTAANDAKKLQFQMNALLLRAARITPKEDQDVTPKFATRSFMIIRSSMIIFGMVARKVASSFLA